MSESTGPDRRPIATRDLKVSANVAGYLARRGVSANLISTLGMFCGVAAGFAFWATSQWPDAARVFWIAGAVLVQLRLAANMFDGMVAIQSGEASPVGELFNEVPDRVSDAATLVGLGLAAGGHPGLGLCAALAAFFTAYVRAAAVVAGAAQQFCGPMAKPQRMFLVTLVALYLGLTPQSWQPQWEQPLPGLPAAALALIFIGSLWTAARRLVRAGRELQTRA